MNSLRDRVLLLVPNHLIDITSSVFDLYKINTVERCSHFLTQVIHESMRFRVKEENLKYSKEGLLFVFKKYFDEKTAKEYEFKPEKIANRVYANRLGNGDEASGDGWKYRGRGFIQITGKANYEAITKDLHVDYLNNPDLLLDDNHAMISAGWFWNKNNLNLLADQGVDNDTIVKVTRRVNGGSNGLSDRLKIFHEVFNKIKR